MNDSGEECYSSGQSTTSVVVSPAPKDSSVRSHGEKLKMMNPTPNGYSGVPNHKHKVDGQDSVKNHGESNNSSDHQKHSSSGKHSSDHVKKRDGNDSMNHKSSSHRKDGLNSKDTPIKSDSPKVKEHSSSKEKKHSSHKDGSKEGKHAESSKHSSMKNDGEKPDESRKEHKHSSSKPKLDNFKENEKVKDLKHKESKDKTKEKHKDKHKEDKDRATLKLYISPEHSKDKSGKVSEHSKEKSEKPKEKSTDKHKEKHSEKSKDKIKDKSMDKPKEKSSEKSKEKSKEKLSESLKEKVKSSHSDQDKSYSSPPKKVKTEIESDDELPLAIRKPVKTKHIKKEIKIESPPIKRELDDESDDEPLSSRAAKTKKVKTEKTNKKRKPESDESDYDDYKKPTKKVKKEKPSQKPKEEPSSPKKKVKKEDDQDVWKWWEEEKLDEGIKWRTLEHNGPVFAPPYERVPKNVKFLYDGKHMELSEVTEEVAGFYGRMLDHDYTTKDSFNKNFFKDWRKVMTPKERELITDLKKCNFNDFNTYYKMKSEERKAMTKEQKLEMKKQNEELTEKYGFCIIDGHKQKIANFKIEPPGLFRGRGDHPKMGMLKRRVEAEDISINISKGAKAPDPPPGHKWKDVRHDNTVTWLASWSENILGSTKYVMLNPSSKLKGEKDWQKYETARKLKNHAQRIRNTYVEDFKSKEMRVRQRAVALYFIDKLALRAGNEKDEDTADTVGCCSLRVEHITLDKEKDGQEHVVSFDFLGKDSIRYFNSVPVEKQVFKNLKLFMENKQPGDDLFDRLNTPILNKYLNELMDGLTAKVFRTYNASKTLQEQLDLLTKEEMSLPEKILAYNRANRAVAVLCNHQRAVPKGFSKSMENLKQKMDDKIKQIKDCKKEVKELKNAAKSSSKDKVLYEKKKKRLQTLEEQFNKLEVQATDKEENKQIALGTSKLNYLDPRISVAWCKKWDISIDKIYNRTQRDKFRWAIEMAGPDFKF